MQKKKKYKQITELDQDNKISIIVILKKENLLLSVWNKSRGQQHVCLNNHSGQI